MAKYRHIHCSFWEDSDVYEWTPEEKYFYLYLMTNPHTTQCGIYQINKKQIVNETGYNIDTVSKLLDRFIEKEKILYNEPTKELCIINWLKYNFSKSPKVKTCVIKELEAVKEQTLIPYLYSIDRLGIDWGEKLKRKIKTKKKNIVVTFQPEYISLSKLLGELILARKPDDKNTLKEQKVGWVNWAKNIRLMATEDNRKLDVIEKVIRWTQQDDFERLNIRSTSKLRKRFDQLEEKTNKKPKESKWF